LVLCPIYSGWLPRARPRSKVISVCQALCRRANCRLTTRERIAIAVAEINGCDYCLSAHSYFGKNLAKLSDDELFANRAGTSLDGKADVAVRFAASVARGRGHIADAELEAVRAAGYDDAQIIEIVQHVALNNWTNYLNNVAETDIDFPVMNASKAA